MFMKHIIFHAKNHWQNHCNVITEFKTIYIWMGIVASTGLLKSVFPRQPDHCFKVNRVEHHKLNQTTLYGAVWSSFWCSTICFARFALLALFALLCLLGLLALLCLACLLCLLCLICLLFLACLIYFACLICLACLLNTRTCCDFSILSHFEENLIAKQRSNMRILKLSMIFLKHTYLL